MSTRTIWIIYGAYLFSAAPEKFDYVKLKAELERQNGEKFCETYYLNPSPGPPKDAQNKFHTFLKKAAPPRGPQMRVQLYKLKTMDVKCPKCKVLIDRRIQKGVDVGIVTLMIKHIET